MLIADIQKRGQFFKANSIIPRRILGCSKKKYQHLVRFGSDAWALPLPRGYLVICDMDTGWSAAIRYVLAKNQHADLQFTGSPYHKNGETVWVGFNGTTSDTEVLLKEAIKGLSCGN